MHFGSTQYGPPSRVHAHPLQVGRHVRLCGMVYVLGVGNTRGGGEGISSFGGEANPLLFGFSPTISANRVIVYRLTISQSSVDDPVHSRNCLIVGILPCRSWPSQAAQNRAMISDCVTNRLLMSFHPALLSSPIKNFDYSPAMFASIPVNLCQLF